jgi:hypothetical protein
MKVMVVVALWFLGSTGAVSSEPIELEGTVCRAGRGAERLIVTVHGAMRHPVVVDSSTHVTFEGGRYETSDVRPGDKVEISGERARSGRIDARRIDVKERVLDALVDSLLGIEPPLVGRFAVREAKTAFFSLNLPGDDYVRVDARGWGYGAVGKLRPGDLIELSGKWDDKRVFSCSSGRILTDQEPDRCRREACKEETKEETAARENAERRFLDGYDLEDEDEEPVEPR